MRKPDDLPGNKLKKDSAMAKKEQKGTILVGDGEELLVFYGSLQHPERVRGIFCSHLTELPEGLVRLGDVDDVPVFVDEHVELQRIYCSTSRISVQRASAVQYACKTRAVRFCLVPPIVNQLPDRLVPMAVGRNMLLTPDSEPLSHLHNRMLKRLFDLLLVVPFMLVVFPFVYILKALLIKRHGTGQSFVTDRCCGPSGRIFRRVSFRLPLNVQPVEDEQDEAVGEQLDTPATKDPVFRSQPRSIARLFNVLTGSMSLVGPECFVMGEEEEPITLPKRLERQEVKPGLTGWAQVSGKTGANRLAADIWYVEHWSLWLDIRILFKSMF